MYGNKRFSIAFKTSLLYFVIGIIWIIISDFLAKHLSPDISTIYTVELIKGILFIFTTTLILYKFSKNQIRELEESEERYKNLFQNHKTVMLLIDPKSGSIIDANKAAERFYGYSLEELKSLKMWDINILPPDKIKIEIEKAKSGEKSYFHFKHRIRTGDIKDVQVYSSPTKIKGENYLFSLVFDITEKIKLEQKNKELIEELKNANESLSSLIENSPLPIIVVNLEGIVKIWNRTAEEVLGWSNEEAIGKFNPLVPVDKIEEFFSLIDRISKGEVLKELEIIRVNKAGKVLTFNLFASPIYGSEGKVKNIIGILEDITEKKKMEEEYLHIKKMESIGKLAAGISHDFNNILTAIIGFGSLIDINTKNNKDLNYYAKQILQVCERASHLTKELLAYSRKHPYNPTPLDLNNLIRGSIAFIERIIGENIEIELSLKEDIKKIYGDFYHIEQILVNLLTNAKDAMPNGGTIYIETSMEDLDENFIMAHKYGKTGKYVRLSISDTGVGMDEETKSKIFDPFFTTKECGKGNNLSYLFSSYRRRGK